MSETVTLFDAKAARVELFVQLATADGLINSMNPERRELVVSFVRDYATHKAPDIVLRDYYLAIAPMKLTFARTHELVKTAVSLLEAWTASEGNTVRVQAETGAWVLGEGEEADLDQLQRLVGSFVKFFGASALPPALRKDALDKQVKSHLAARRAMPPEPPKQKFTELRSERRSLSERCDEAFDAFHDFLDGHFGRKGPTAFERKTKYGYDRRAGRYAPSKAKAEARTTGAKTEGKTDTKPEGSGPSATPEPPGAVASGAAGTPAATTGTAPQGAGIAAPAAAASGTAASKES